MQCNKFYCHHDWTNNSGTQWNITILEECSSVWQGSFFLMEAFVSLQWSYHKRLQFLKPECEKFWGLWTPPQVFWHSGHKALHSLAWSSCIIWLLYIMMCRCNVCKKYPQNMGHNNTPYFREWLLYCAMFGGSRSNSMAVCRGPKMSWGFGPAPGIRAHGRHIKIWPKMLALGPDPHNGKWWTS